MLHFGALIHGLRATSSESVSLHNGHVRGSIDPRLRDLSRSTDLFTIIRIAGRFKTVHRLAILVTLFLRFVNANYPMILVPCGYFTYILHIIGVTLEYYISQALFYDPKKKV